MQAPTPLPPSGAVPLAPPLALVPAATLPHNVEAEAALLGALMIDNRLVEDVQLRLGSQHFFEPLHGRVYDAILMLIDRRMTATPVTLKPLFDADPEMMAIGGTAYLATLTEQSAALIAARDFAQQIYDLALLREMIRVGREMATNAFDTMAGVEPLKQIEAAELALYKVAEQGEVAGSVKTFGEATKMAIQMAEKAYKSGGHLSGYTTGLTGLNEKIGGLHKSDLIILAGRPAMGKTALATNIAFSAAYRYLLDRADDLNENETSGAGVAFFSLEMSADQLATRILAEQSGVDSERIRTGKISQSEFNDLARAAGKLNALPLYIDDTPALSIAALRTRARRLKRQKNVGIIVVDYLQLLQGSSRSSNENRVQEISEISRGLKTLAKELSVPVLALSQLSRAVESREDKRPQLSDLRESGSIEQDADIVLFVYREEYYHSLHEPTVPTEASGNETTIKYDLWLKKKLEIQGQAEVIVGKQRHGSTGQVRLLFNSVITKFSDPADESRLPERR